MCEFQQLAHNDSGHILYCSACNTYQVCFLSTLVALYPEEFSALRRHIAQKIAEDYYYTEEGIRNIFIPTFTRSVHMLLTRREVLLLHDILEDADTEKKVLSLIRLFNA